MSLWLSDICLSACLAVYSLSVSLCLSVCLSENDPFVCLLSASLLSHVYCLSLCLSVYCLFVDFLSTHMSVYFLSVCLCLRLSTVFLFLRSSDGFRVFLKNRWGKGIDDLRFRRAMIGPTDLMCILLRACQFGKFASWGIRYNPTFCCEFCLSTVTFSSTIPVL